MITEDDARHILEFDDYYIIEPEFVLAENTAPGESPAPIHVHGHGHATAFAGMVGRLDVGTKTHPAVVGGGVRHGRTRIFLASFHGRG